jgi:hypothetical protein
MCFDYQAMKLSFSVIFCSTSELFIENPVMQREISSSIDEFDSQLGQILFSDSAL